MAGSAPAAGRIFISYRREETAYPAALLFDRLATRFGPKQIFKDVDAIEPGDDFVAVLTTAVDSCDVLLALIGNRWLTITDHEGRRRLDNPDDFVRLEIEAALTRGIRVIPILVEDARMPRADELPASLARLVRRQAIELSPSGLEIRRLLRVLEKALAASTGPEGREPPPKPPPEDGETGSTEPGSHGLVPTTAPEGPGDADSEGPAPTDPGASTTDRPATPSDSPPTPGLAEWAPDPFKRHELRFWDGATWTEHVSDIGVVAVDRPGAAGRKDPRQATLKLRPRLQPLPETDDAATRFPLHGAAVYLSRAKGVMVIPDRYATVGELLDELPPATSATGFPWTATAGPGW